MADGWFPARAHFGVCDRLHSHTDLASAPLSAEDRPTLLDLRLESSLEEVTFADTYPRVTFTCLLTEAVTLQRFGKSRFCD